MARLMGTGYLAWLSFPTWQIRSALERHPEIEGHAAMDCRVWAACEGFMRSDSVIRKELASSSPCPDRAALDEDMATPVEVGRPALEAGLLGVLTC